MPDRPETVTLAVFKHRRERAYALRDPKARAEAVKALGKLHVVLPERDPRDVAAEAWLTARHSEDWYLGDATDDEWAAAYAAVDAEAHDA